MGNPPVLCFVEHERAESTAATLLAIDCAPCMVNSQREMDETIEFIAQAHGSTLMTPLALTSPSMFHAAAKSISLMTELSCPWVVDASHLSLNPISRSAALARILRQGGPQVLVVDSLSNFFLVFQIVCQKAKPESITQMAVLVAAKLRSVVVVVDTTNDVIISDGNHLFCVQDVWNDFHPRVFQFVSILIASELCRSNTENLVRVVCDSLTHFSFCLSHSMLFDTNFPSYESILDCLFLFRHLPRADQPHACRVTDLRSPRICKSPAHYPMIASELQSYDLAHERALVEYRKQANEKKRLERERNQKKKEPRRDSFWFGWTTCHNDVGK
eukprot:c5789_g1_i2.p1 GENE.c5789_g1_i2~~c5789_g1_i2.p1  ORF type:complete len:330 (+),score=55.62 c5789_g1_i2:26-1015(+)